MGGTNRVECDAFGRQQKLSSPMINQQQQQAVFSLLIQDSKRIFEIISERHALYNALLKTTSPQDLAQSLRRHQTISSQENALIQKYQCRTIRNIHKLKSFFIRFHCRLDEMLTKLNIDTQIIKFTASDNFQLLKQEEVNAQSVVRGLFLHPKMETQRLLHRSMRNKSLKDIKEVKIDSKHNRNSSFYSVPPENKELYREWSKHSRRLYDALGIQTKDTSLLSRPRMYNRDCLLQEIIERNRSIQHSIKDYKKSYNIQRKVTSMRKIAKDRPNERSKTLKSSGQCPLELNSKFRKLMQLRRISPKPLQIVIDGANLIY